MPVEDWISKKKRDPTLLIIPYPNMGEEVVSVIEKKGALIKEVSGELKGGSKIRLAADQELLESWESDPLLMLLFQSSYLVVLA